MLLLSVSVDFCSAPGVVAVRPSVASPGDARFGSDTVICKTTQEHHFERVFVSWHNAQVTHRSK